jgi:hypothetical protein
MNIITIQRYKDPYLQIIHHNFTKAKAVPLHAMKVLGGRGGIAPINS